MLILDGKKISQEISVGLKNKISLLERAPKLAIVQVGDDSDSNLYIKKKINFGEEIGAEVELNKFQSDILEDDLISEIKNLNTDNSVDGIILQLPIPENLNKEKVINAISPKKDVDGMTAENLNKFFSGEGDFVIPATARGIITLLEKYDLEIKRKKVVVVGDSIYVGKSIAVNFKNHCAEVISCNSRTENISEIAKGADILISAAGSLGLITDDYVNKDQIIIDVGINFNENGKVTGDVKLGKAEPFAISPVPGGVGPMTVVSLFLNLIDRV